MVAAFVLLALAVGCEPPLAPIDADGDGAPTADADHDGYDASVDCNDGDGRIHPNAEEKCNWVDDDCDGEIDDGVHVDCHPDVDEDGFGAAGEPWAFCDAACPPTTTADGSDCDDADPEVNPEAEEVCNLLDDDCDGQVDEDLLLVLYRDFDGDGWGDSRFSSDGCLREGFTRRHGDCDDRDPSRHPQAVERPCNGLDDNCDGVGDGLCPTLDLDDEAVVISGVDAIDFAGSAVAGAGDVNGDGHADLLVGAPGDTSASDYTGAAYLVLGQATPDSLGLSDADAIFLGTAADDHAAEAVAGAGDVDGDGLDDVLIGASWASGVAYGAGAAYLVLGRYSPADIGLADADARFDGEDVVGLAGSAVAGAGDVDGDGFADLLIGAPWSDCGGVAYLVRGGPELGDRPLSSADARYLGGACGDCAGTAVAGVGDADGDGLDDVMIGAPSARSGRGMACLVLGCARPADLALFNADACLVGEELDVAGESVAAGGDVDGDGLCDLLVGAPYHDEVVDRVGAAYLVLGNAAPADASLAAADARYLGVDADDWAGTSIAGLGDVDGDGFGDLLVGVPHDDSTAERAGMAAYLRGGPAILGVLDVAATLRLQGSSAGDEAGSAVAAAGDFDGDGVPDALVGAPGAEGGAGTGAAYLVLGATLF